MGIRKTGGQRTVAFLGSLLMALPGLVLAASPAATPPATTPEDEARALAAGRDLAVAPGADFYSYANGVWMKDTEIPADRSYFGTFNILQDRSDKRVADLIQELARTPAAEGTEARKVGDYFASYMDEDAIDAKGLAPLTPRLQAIAAIADRKALSRLLGTTLHADVDVLNATNFFTPNVLGLWVAQDLDAPDTYAAFLLQGGLGMPNRDYYLLDNERMSNFRARYRDHVRTVLGLLGDKPDEAAASAEAVLALEIRIAQVHATPTESEDVKLGNNHWTRAQFDTLAPGMDWTAYFLGAGLPAQPVFVAWHPKAITGISALVASEPLSTWKAYLRFHAADTNAGVLPKAFRQENFAFYEGILSGTPKQSERWKRAVGATSADLGEAVGHLYVDRYFPASSKAQIEQMVHNLIGAFDRRIDALAWMAPQTKQRAKAKLASLKVGVGYPNRWRDYSMLKITRGDAWGNHERARAQEDRRNLAKLGKPIDREEWVMNPQLVNAVNLPVMNAIHFPAAILEPPFFSATASAAMNYGAIGAVIGHEISHSFDNTGALFDATGRLNNWWTPEDLQHFEASGEALAKQYDAYRPFPDLAVNGHQTLGENIADLAGIAAAYDAYRQSLGAAPAPVLGDLSGDQQFFLSFARYNAAKGREPIVRRIVITDGHALGMYRAATVRNVDAWYAAFGAKAGEALYLAPQDRVRVW